MFLAPPDDENVVYESYAPFAHIPGRYEWCRIIGPTHGVFDAFIVLGASTSVAATVYVSAGNGEQFMADRYPECATIRANSIAIGSSRGGRTVRGRMEADAGPVRMADFALIGDDVVPQPTTYGGDGAPVWGSKWTCWGVDHNIPARAQGFIVTEEGRQELDGVNGIVAMGSFGRISPYSG